MNVFLWKRMVDKEDILVVAMSHQSDPAPLV